MKWKFFLLAMLAFSYEGYNQNESIFKDASIYLVGNSDDTAKYLNFNPLINFSLNKQIIFSEKLNNNSSFFWVFQDTSRLGKKLLDIKYGRNTLEINRGNITKNGVEILVDLDTCSTKIRSFITGMKLNKCKNEICLNEGTLKEGPNCYEFIYFPEIVDEIKARKIESSLSVKYGISLTEGVYINSIGDTLWDILLSSPYNKNITGIGRDDFLNLNQSKSHNINDKYLTIEVTQGHYLYDHDYIMWADNGKTFPTRLISDPKIERREWLIKNYSNSSKRIDVRLDTLALIKDQIGKNNTVWLLNWRENYTIQNCLFHKPQNTGGTYSFPSIFLKPKEDESFFTFLVAPDFFALKNEVSSACEEFDLHDILIRIVGGEAPYSISLSNSKNNITRLIDDSLMLFNNLTPDEYIFTINDRSGNCFTDKIKIDAVFQRKVIDDSYIIANKDVLEVIPFISNNNYDYSWYKEDEVISKEKNLKLNEDGDYKLILKNIAGCQSEYPFKVSLIPQLDINISPNPAFSLEPITISFNSPLTEMGELAIYDSQFKLVQSMKLQIDDIDKSIVFQNPGLYLLKLRLNGAIYTSKLIII